MAYDSWGVSWGSPSKWGVSWFHPDAPPPTPAPPSEGPVGGGNIWYVSEEMLRRYREHQARLRKYEPEDDRADLRAIVERAVRGNTQSEEVLPVAEVAKAVQAVAADEFDFRAPLKVIRELLAEVERLEVLYAQRDEEEIFIVGLLS